MVSGTVEVRRVISRRRLHEGRKRALRRFKGMFRYLLRNRSPKPVAWLVGQDRIVWRTYPPAEWVSAALGFLRKTTKKCSRPWCCGNPRRNPWAPKNERLTRPERRQSTAQEAFEEAEEHRR
jgi:hypothetical protein